MAPVGPDTWKFETPKAAAMTPATMAVKSPAAARVFSASDDLVVASAMFVGV